MTHHMTLPVSDSTRAYIIRLQAEQAAQEEKERQLSEAALKAASSAWKPAAEIGRVWTFGTRRLKDLPPHVRRPLECHQASMRRGPVITREEMSSRLDLHPDDLGALAATAGSI